MISSLLLVLLTLSSPGAAATSGEAGVAVDVATRARLPIRDTARNPTSAVVRGDRMWLADNGPGLAEYDLGHGGPCRVLDVLDASQGTRFPEFVGGGPGGFAVYDSLKTWHLFNQRWRATASWKGLRAQATSSPVVLADRLVVFGWAGEELTGDIPAWLFIHRQDGTVIPLGNEPADAGASERIGRVGARITLAGGVAALPGGRWAAVDPLDPRLLVFDERDRLVASTTIAHPDVRAPDASTLEPPTQGDDASHRQMYRWFTSQTLVKRPAVVGDDLIGVVVGLPAEGGTQRHELDLYRLDGTIVASGIELPGVVAARLIVADAEPGRLVLLGMERNWPRADEMTVWEVEVEVPEPTGEE